MKLPLSAYNKITLIGSIISVATLFLFLFLFFTSHLITEGSPYLGIFNFLVLPAILIIGLLLIPLGMYLKSRRLKKGTDIPEKKMIIDLNQPRHRNAVIVFIVGTIIFLILSGVGSYEAYHFTESVKFCGTTCHEVMEPEYTTYQNSPHARVSCAECHVGSGANWYVKSKISGLYQVYSVIFNKYPRPIETPISSLRPARETCEECHWPQKFYTPKLVHEKHYLADENNTEWNIDLRMRIGASHAAQGLAEGIHWHINPDVKIEYKASHDRESIPWVRYINLATGDTTIYLDPETEMEQGTIDSAEVRLMDCMDCHNRPSHRYLTPQRFVDNSMAAGEIPPSLPEIKRLTMEIFNENYPTVDTASLVIQTKINDFYKENYPDIYSSKQDLVKKAVNGTIKGYKTNIFPRMNANWDVYPDHIGHIVYNGCFRCHNDTHASESGKVISKDCNLCHTILSQGPADSMQVSTLDKPLEFRHPVDIKDTWKTSKCSECHRYLYQ